MCKVKKNPFISSIILSWFLLLNLHFSEALFVCTLWGTSESLNIHYILFWTIVLWLFGLFYGVHNNILQSVCTTPLWLEALCIPGVRKFIVLNVNLIVSSLRCLFWFSSGGGYWLPSILLTTLLFSQIFTYVKIYFTPVLKCNKHFDFEVVGEI